MQLIDEQTNDQCVGCGDLAAFCVSARCADTLQDHAAGIHDGCDLLVCEDASLTALDPWAARSPMNGST